MDVDELFDPDSYLESVNPSKTVCKYKLNLNKLLKNETKFSFYTGISNLLYKCMHKGLYVKKIHAGSII